MVYNPIQLIKFSIIPDLKRQLQNYLASVQSMNHRKNAQDKLLLLWQSLVN